MSGLSGEYSESEDISLNPLVKGARRVGEVVNFRDKPVSTGNIPVRLSGGVEVHKFALLAAADREYVYVLRVLDLLNYTPLASPEGIAVRETILRESVTPSEVMEHIAAFSIAKTELIDIIKLECKEGKKELKLIGPKKVPMPATPVYEASNGIVMSLCGKLETPVAIGNLIDTEIPAVIDVQKLSRHAIIVGTTGTGKSWLRGVLLEKLYDLGIPQLVFDPLRDYVKATEELGGVNLRYGDNFLPPLHMLTPSVFRELLEDVLTPLQQALAVKAFAKFRTDVLSSGRSYDPYDLLSYIERAARELRAKEETKSNTLARVEVLLRELGYGDGRVTGLARYYVAEKKGSGIFMPEDLAKLLNEKRVVNIDLAGTNDLQFQVTVATLLESVVRLREKRVIPPLIVSFDEAHRIVPRVRGGRAPPSVPVVKNLIRYGRHYGIGIIAITQFPNSVDIELIRLPATRFIFAIDSDQLEAISGILGDLPREIKEQLPKLEAGTAFIAGTADVMRHTIYVRITDKRRTSHGGETPKFRVLRKPGEGSEAS